MRLVDTHCHLDLDEYRDDLEDVISRAIASGVERIIVPGISVHSSRKAVELSETFPCVYAAVGIHPHEAGSYKPERAQELRDLAVMSDKVIAVGEIGLDNYKGYSSAADQQRLLKDCLVLAKELDLPVILHDRQAHDELTAILRETVPFSLKGVMHCFSGDETLLEQALRMDLFISFTGTVTFRNAGKTRELISRVPMERLLLETDGPYMAPVPERGKRNEPAFLTRMLDVYADIYGVSPEDIARTTTHNANALFRLGTEKNSTVTYVIRDSIYVNVTHRCTNRCSFCARTQTDYVKGYDLKLDADPTTSEIVESLGDVRKYREVVFCGFGEPMLRLGTLKRVAAYVREKGVEVRLNTNGEGDLISRTDTARELAGLVNRVSVSVNAVNEEDYQHTCRSSFGKDAYASILGFISSCVREGIKVEVTCLDFLGETSVSGIKEMAQRSGAVFRLRHLNVVG